MEDPGIRIFTDVSTISNSHARVFEHHVAKCCPHRVKSLSGGRELRTMLMSQESKELLVYKDFFFFFGVQSETEE